MGAGRNKQVHDLKTYNAAHVLFNKVKHQETLDFSYWNAASQVALCGFPSKT